MADPHVRVVTTNGVRLRVRVAGPEAGPLVLLLHGFPEGSYGWRHQVPSLAAAGYRVWAPDQRGYDASDRPERIAAYDIDELADDVTGLIDAAGRSRAAVVGHDWGGVVAWHLARRAPERISKMVVLNVPHPSVMRAHLRTSLAQFRRSLYILGFQVPWLPERLLGRDDGRALARAMVATSRPGTFSEAELAEYRRSWSGPGAIRAMLDWYRAYVRRPPDLGRDPRVTVPTLLVWGAQDRFLGREMARPSIELCDDGRLVVLESATHWLQHEEPDRVNALIDAFLRGEGSPSREGLLASAPSDPGA
jgi:epoxide hydrolase 4